MNLQSYIDIHSMGALSKLIGVSPSFISQWVSGVRPVPIRTCTLIEKRTKGAVPRQELIDDWFDIWPELVALPVRAEAV